MTEKEKEFLDGFSEFEECKFCEYFQPHVVCYRVMSCVKNGSDFRLGKCDKFELCQEISGLLKEFFY